MPFSSAQQSFQHRISKINSADVAKHNTKNDCWVIINGRVYDVTAFLPDHPGGDVLLEGAGRDATQLFEDNLHSEEARKILQRYIVGELMDEVK